MFIAWVLSPLIRAAGGTESDGIKWRWFTSRCSPSFFLLLSLRSSYKHSMRSSLRLTRLPRAIRPPPRALRTYAKISPDTPPPQAPYEVFDEPSKWRQRDRALARLREAPGGSEIGEDGRGDTKIVDYLREELADRLSERVEVSLR